VTLHDQVTQEVRFNGRPLLFGRDRVPTPHVFATFLLTGNLLASWSDLSLRLLTDLGLWGELGVMSEYPDPASERYSAVLAFLTGQQPGCLSVDFAATTGADGSWIPESHRAGQRYRINLVPSVALQSGTEPAPHGFFNQKPPSSP
jgi:hypothetical protein